jgi:asparagine synthase (glutamine-hydrolysing)
MPGIVGILTRASRKQTEIELSQMVEAIRHENFYTTGTWIDDSLGVYVGWVARKGSFSDDMPLRNETGEVVLAFSGEEFPEAGTASRLTAQGHSFNQTNSSYLVHLSEEDPGFPAKLNGWFQGLLINRPLGTTMLFNDRYGMHKIYYHQSKEAFYFSAEAKAILAVRSDLRTLDSKGLGEFVSCGSLLGDQSLFEGIQILPNASSWLFRNGSLEQKKTYFNPKEWESQPVLSPEPYYHGLRNVFSQNLPRYFGGNQGIGMSLTGGLDGRMEMAWKNPSENSIPCYTFGGMFRDCRDVVVARKVARAAGQSHRVIEIGRDFLNHFARYAERTVYLTDGAVEVNHSPDLYAHEQVRQIAPVRMTGNYGGEVLRRIRAFKPVEPLPGLFCPELLTYVRKAVDSYSALKQSHPLSFNLFHQIPRGYGGLLTLEQTQIALRSPYLDNDLVRMVYQGPESAFGTSLCQRLIADGNPALSKIPTDRGLADGGVFAAASQGVLEFLFKAEYAYDSGMPQWLAQIDHFISPLHPERFFLGRHKFSHFRVWYRDALSSYVQEVLLDPRTLARPYIERKQLEAIVGGHLKGTRNYTTEINKILSIELLHRLFLDA